MCAQVQTAHGTYVGLPAAFDSSRAVEVTMTEAGGGKTELKLPGLAEGEIIPADRISPQTPAATWIDEHVVMSGEVVVWIASDLLMGEGLPLWSGAV